MPSIEERVRELEATAGNHQAMINLLVAIGERQQTLLEEIQTEVKEIRALQVNQNELLEEVRRDSQQTQRLWVRLAQRYGWLEDDDLSAN